MTTAFRMAKRPRVGALWLAGWILLSPAQSHADFGVTIGQNFTGSTFGIDSFWLPAGPSGAAGPNHFVELLNGRFSVYDKTDGSRVQTMTGPTFWSRAGISLGSGWSPLESRIVYDSSVERWFALAEEVYFDPAETLNPNRLFLAVSATANPTGAWNGVAILGDPNGNNFADSSRLGFDALGVYLSANMFNQSGNDLNSALISIPKADLLAAVPSADNRTYFSLGFSERGIILQPAICVDGSGVGSVLAVGNVYTGIVLKASTVLNSAGPGPATLAPAMTILVPPYTYPINPPQPDGTQNLDDGDSDFTAAVYEVGGVLFAVHGTEVNHRAAIRWYRIDAATGSLLETGTIADPVLDLFYPSIAANASGTIVIAFNGSSAQTFVSSYAVVGQTVSGVTTFGDLLLLQSGTASYHQDGSGGDSFWGEYSATSVDPSDPSRFWTIQTCVCGPSTWCTQITELITSIVPPSAPSFTGNDPTNRTVTQCQGSSLSAIASGVPGPVFQWYHNGSRITDATNSYYAITSMDDTDAGTYFLVATNSQGAATSHVATVSYQSAPAFELLRVVAQTNGVEMMLSFSLPVDPNSIADYTFIFDVQHRGNPANDLNILGASLTNGTNLILRTDARTEGVNYDLFIDAPGPASACLGTYLTGTFQIAQPVRLIPFSATWRYLDDDSDPGPAWFTSSFSDNAWSQGPGVFDAKRGANGTAGGDCRDLTLYGLGRVGTCIRLTSPATQTNIPTYFFRTHFIYPGDPTQALLQFTGKFDDAAIVYLNGNELERVGGLPPPPTVIGRGLFGETWNTRTVGDNDPPDTAEFAAPASLRQGDNLLAVMLIQERAASSDATMGLQMDAFLTTVGPVLTVDVPDALGHTQLHWPSGILQSANHAEGDGPTHLWQDVPSATSPYGIVIDPAGSNTFYRLR